MTRKKKEEIRKVTFREDRHLKIEVLDLEALTEKYAPFITQPHRANFYHIFLFKNCKPVHMVDFSKIKITPHSLLFVNKENVHMFDDKSSYQGKLIIFTDDFFCITDNDRQFLHNSILFNDLYKKNSIQLRSSESIFCLLINQLEAELKSGYDDFQQGILHNLLHNLLLQAERFWSMKGYLHAHKGPDFDYAVLFRDLLEQHFTTTRLVSDYAGMMAITEKRLNKATTTALGKSPKQVIEDRILLEAKRLLAHTNQSVKEIALVLGFDEPTYFIRFFRKQMKETPVEFREQFRK